MTDRRRELLRIMAPIEQLMAEAESVLVGNTDDEILLRTSELLAEHRSMMADVEWKLTDCRIRLTRRLTGCLNRLAGHR